MESVAAQTSTASADASHRDPRSSVRADHGVGARAARELDELGAEVDAEDAASGRPRDSHGELADQPQPDHGDGRPDLDIGPAEAVHRHGPEGGEGRILGRNPVRDLGAQERGDHVQLGVAREAPARDRHAVPGLQAAGLRPRLDHDAGGAVAERAELLELLANQLDGGAHPVLTHALDHLPRLVGPCPRLRDQALAGDVERRPLGSRAEHRSLHPHRDRPGPGSGVGDLDQVEAPVLEASGDLAHQVAHPLLPEDLGTSCAEVGAFVSGT